MWEQVILSMSKLLNACKEQVCCPQRVLFSRSGPTAFCSANWQKVGAPGPGSKSSFHVPFTLKLRCGACTHHDDITCTVLGAEGRTYGWVLCKLLDAAVALSLQEVDALHGSLLAPEGVLLEALERVPPVKTFTLG